VTPDFGGSLRVYLEGADRANRIHSLALEIRRKIRGREGAIGVGGGDDSCAAFLTSLLGEQRKSPGRGILIKRGEKMISQVLGLPARTL